MKVILNPSNEEIIKELNQNKLVIIPTDTIYGLACRIEDYESKNRIYELKKRSVSKPLSIIVNSIAMAQEFMRLNDDIIDKLSAEHSITVIGELDCKKDYKTLQSSNNTVALRITKAKWLQEVISRTGALFATSVNISDYPAASNLAELLMFDVDTLFYNGELELKASPIYDSFRKVFTRI